MTRYLIALVLALPATAAHAQTLTYMCKVGSRVYPVTANVKKATLTWRGTTFRDLKKAQAPDVCAKYGWTATNNGVTATLCSMTQGVGSLTIGKDDFDCQIKSK